MFKTNVFALLAVGLVAISAASVDDSSSSSSEDADDLAEPSLLGVLGSKVAIADNVYEEYDEDDDDDLDHEMTTAAPPKPCCFPAVWQGRIQTRFGFAPIGGGRRSRSGDDVDDDDFDKKGKKKRGGRRRGRALASRAVDQVFVDGNNKRLAGNVVECHGKGKVLNVSYIMLARADQSADLYLFNQAAQKCRYRQLKGAAWRPQCLPPDATLRGQFSLGPAAGGLTVQSWSFSAGSKRAKAALIDEDYSAVDDDDEDEDELSNDLTATTPRPRPRPRPRPKMFVAATALVVPNACVPVVIQEEGAVLVGGRSCDFQDDDDDDRRPKPRPKPKCRPRGEAFVGSAVFSGLQTTITDPTVFNVPSYCKKTPNTLFYDEMEDEMPAAVERFFVL